MDESLARILFQITVISLGVLGIALIAGFLLAGATRRYLLYLGIISLACAGVGFFTSPVTWVIWGVVLVLFVLAVRDGVRDTKERLRRWRQEEEERAEAFVEMTRELEKSRDELRN